MQLYILTNIQIRKMKRLFLHTVMMMATLWLASCSGVEEIPSVGGTGTVVLSLVRGNVPQVATRAIDSDLALDIVRSDGSVYRQYAAGEVPDKMEVEAGVTYTLRIYTDNQTTWQTAADGAGEACYYGETNVIVGEDETVYCTYRVPMTNYAVTLTLPELFDELFSSYTFTVSGSGRDVSLREGQKAYFSLRDDGFTYQLQATNTDGRTSRHAAIEYPEVAAGKLYNIRYMYATDFNSGGIDIDITDNTEHEDVDIPL